MARKCGRRREIVEGQCNRFFCLRTYAILRKDLQTILIVELPNTGRSGTQVSVLNVRDVLYGAEVSLD